ncbi:MAG: ZIP family metal transporter [Candidatus Levybacteria bacterium]|nr:ZIP family metal transporter [Candidatus Levybacteria bacterium]
MLPTILFFTFLGSVISLIGGIILLFKKNLILKISHLLISFAAGTLLGTAFFDLLPEAQGEAGDTNIFLWTLVGILFFFLLERFIHWFHYHSENVGGKHIEPEVPLIILGDSLHNFIDGVVIAGTFLVSIPLGIITTLAVAAHEIPQEIGDFAILINKGLNRKKVLIFNIFSALTAMIGAVLMFFLKDLITGILPITLSLTAGFFIYIASSDLIPEIHHEKRKWFALYEVVLLFLGVLTIWVLVSSLE